MNSNSIIPISLFDWNSSSGGWIISRLSILSAERQHSGIYACSINNSTTATVDVQILNGMLVHSIYTIYFL